MFYTHINRNIIDRNRKRGEAEPAVRIQEGKYGKPEYAFEVELPAGSRVVYVPHGDPVLPCGARLVITSPVRPEIVR